nr:hypothetical protein CFP56_76821 [Quercus suber]
MQRVEIEIACELGDDAASWSDLELVGDYRTSFPMGMSTSEALTDSTSMLRTAAQCSGRSAAPAPPRDCWMRRVCHQVRHERHRDRTLLPRPVRMENEGNWLSRGGDPHVGIETDKITVSVPLICYFTAPFVPPATGHSATVPDRRQLPRYPHVELPTHSSSQPLLYASGRPQFRPSCNPSEEVQGAKGTQVSDVTSNLFQPDSMSPGCKSHRDAPTQLQCCMFKSLLYRFHLHASGRPPRDRSAADVLGRIEAKVAPVCRQHHPALHAGSIGRPRSMNSLGRRSRCNITSFYLDVRIKLGIHGGRKGNDSRGLVARSYCRSNDATAAVEMVLYRSLPYVMYGLSSLSARDCTSCKMVCPKGVFPVARCILVSLGLICRSSPVRGQTLGVGGHADERRLQRLDDLSVVCLMKRLR